MAKSKLKSRYVVSQEYEDLENTCVYNTIKDAEEECLSRYYEDDEFIIYELVPVKKGKVIVQSHIEWEK